MAKFYARPIIPLLIALIAGIYLGSQFPGFLLWATGFLCLGAGLLMISIVRQRIAWASPFVVFVAIGYLSLQPWVCPKFPSDHIIHFLDMQGADIEGVIDNRPLIVKNRQKFVLRVERLGIRGNFQPVTGKLRITVAGEGPLFHIGDRVFLNGRIRSIRNFNNPGGFDYKRYMAFQGVWGTVYVQATRINLLKNSSRPVLSKIIGHARDRIAHIIEDTGQGSQIGVLKALVVGDRAAIPHGTREAFNRAGVGHLLAISGLHIGIVATAAFIFFQRILASIRPLLWKAWTRKGAALLSLLPVCFYGLISGLSPSTQRAVIMISVFLVTYLFEREHDLINTLATAALLILVIFPPSLFSISFQLSFSAVLSIIYGLNSLKPLRSRNQETIQRPGLIQIKNRLVTFFLVSLLAIGGTLPLVMFYFNQISIVGILANFIIVPLVGFIVVPLGLVAVFISAFCLNCAAWCFKACGAVLAFSLKLVDFFADLPFAAVKMFTPTIFEISCYYAFVWALLSMLASQQTRTTQPSGGLQTASDKSDILNHRAAKNSRFTSISFFKCLITDSLTYFKGGNSAIRRRKAIAIVVLFVLAGDACYWLYDRFWHKDLRVTFIDVGQGNAALLELPDGYNILIDGGGFSDNSVFDMGARVLAPFLWRKKIKTVDTLILSHPNSDHLNGLIYIAEHFNVRNVWTNNEERDIFAYRVLMEIVASKNIALPEFDHLPRKQILSGVEVSILYPRKNFLKRKITEKWRNSNNNSLVIRISLGSISFLFPGDIMAEAEKEVVEISSAALRSTVLLAPHHGSKSSSTALFIDDVDPQVVVISSGWKDSFRFPHSSVLERYRHRGCKIFRTDTHGAITLSTDGQRLSIKPFCLEANASVK